MRYEILSVNILEMFVRVDIERICVKRGGGFSNAPQNKPF